MPSKKKTLEKKTSGQKNTRRQRGRRRACSGKTLLEKLKTAPPGASGRRDPHGDAPLGVPVHQVKAALKKVEPKEPEICSSPRSPAAKSSRSLRFAARFGVLFPAPWEPPAPSPPPAPTGGPPASILTTTTYQNVPFPPAEKDLELVAGSSAGVRRSGSLSPPPWECGVGL